MIVPGKAHEFTLAADFMICLIHKSCACPLKLKSSSSLSAPLVNVAHGSTRPERERRP
jgi:hypothetical protein